MLRLLSLDTKRAFRSSGLSRLPCSRHGLREGARALYLSVVLPHVRWQFLSTEVLLKACRDRDVRIDSCLSLTEALHWLLDSTASQRERTRRQAVRRDSYREDVAEIRPSQRATQYLRSKVKVVLQTSHEHL